MAKFIIISSARGVKYEQTRKNTTRFLVPRPGQGGPNASGWYGRLREPISQLLVIKSYQLWLQACHVPWHLLANGIFLPRLSIWSFCTPTVIFDTTNRYNLDSLEFPPRRPHSHCSFRLCNYFPVSLSFCFKKWLIKNNVLGTCDNNDCFYYSK